MLTNISQLDLTKKYTYADYLTWQFDEMVELIKGYVHRMAPAPLSNHQEVSGEIFVEIHNILKPKKCKIYHAPFDVRLQRNIDNEQVTTVVQPDICVVCDTSKIDERGCNGAPDLIVEILSPSTSRKDVKDKFEVYEESGVKEYWIVEPVDKLIDVFALSDNKYQFIKKYVEDDIIQSVTLPEIVIDLKNVFG